MGYRSRWTKDGYPTATTRHRVADPDRSAERLSHRATSDEEVRLRHHDRPSRSGYVVSRWNRHQRVRLRNQVRRLRLSRLDSPLVPLYRYVCMKCSHSDGELRAL